METLMQNGPCSTACCRITMIWITFVSRHLLKWPERHPWKMSHSCRKQEMVWNAPSQSCHQHIDMRWTNVSFFQGTGTGNAGRLYCGVVLTYCGGTSEERVPALGVFNSGEGGCLRGASHRAGVKIKNLQQAGWGLRSRTSPWSTCSNCLPSLIVRALLIMLCKSWEMDFTFPPARLCTALHLLSPFKNTESSEKGNGSFLFVHQQSWHRPVKQSSWAVICKAALCRLIPQPPGLFTRHTQTSARLKTSYFVIRQNLSAWVMKVLQRLLTSHQINLELCPQHLVLIPMAEW